jgi:glucose-6-phosphate isomerase
LIGLWHSNLFDAQTVAELPCEQYLKRFPAYLQQTATTGASSRVDQLYGGPTCSSE